MVTQDAGRGMDNGGYHPKSSPGALGSGELKILLLFIFYIFYQFIILSSLQEKLSTEWIIISINFQYCDKLPLTDPILLSDSVDNSS